MMSDRRLLSVLMVALLSCAVGGDSRALECPAGSTPRRGVPVDDSRTWANGIREAEWCERDGMKHGPYRDWYPSGAQFRSSLYSEGELHGVRTIYRPNGSILSRSEHRNGRPFGEAIKFASDGRVAQRTTYRWVGERTEAHVRTFGKGGLPLAEGHLVDGKRDGPWTYFDESGKRDAIEVWKGGRIVSEPQLELEDSPEP